MHNNSIHWTALNGIVSRCITDLSHIVKFVAPVSPEVHSGDIPTLMHLSGRLSVCLLHRCWPERMQRVLCSVYDVPHAWLLCGFRRTRRRSCLAQTTSGSAPSARQQCGRAPNSTCGRCPRCSSSSSSASSTRACDLQSARRTMTMCPSLWRCAPALLCAARGVDPQALVC
jgi:hypothetical protein